MTTWNGYIPPATLAWGEPTPAPAPTETTPPPPANFQSPGPTDSEADWHRVFVIVTVFLVLLFIIPCIGVVIGKYLIPFFKRNSRRSHSRNGNGNGNRNRDGNDLERGEVINLRELGWPQPDAVRQAARPREGPSARPAPTPAPAPAAMPQQQRSNGGANDGFQEVPLAGGSAGTDATRPASNNNTSGSGANSGIRHPPPSRSRSDVTSVRNRADMPSCPAPVARRATTTTTTPRGLPRPSPARRANRFLDTDDDRLPHGLRRIGYDADDQTYTFEDDEGNRYVSGSGARYGELRRI